MAKTITTKRGRIITLLNPSEKGRKYADELRSGLRITNDGVIKENNGNPLVLSDLGKAYRSGYLDAQKDSAKAYKSKFKKR